MLYMLLINSDESHYPEMSDEDMSRLMDDYRTFTENLEKDGAFKESYRLQPTSTATTVRVRDGKTLTTDGPFAETKEQFGGYYLIDVPDLDAALGWAAQVPSATYGSVEVRPVWEMDE